MRGSGINCRFLVPRFQFLADFWQFLPKNFAFAIFFFKIASQFWRPNLAVWRRFLRFLVAKFRKFLRNFCKICENFCKFSRIFASQKLAFLWGQTAIRSILGFFRGASGTPAAPVFLAPLGPKRAKNRLAPVFCKFAFLQILLRKILRFCAPRFARHLAAASTFCVFCEFFALKIRVFCENF